MSENPRGADVLVIGGGIIGLALAWRAAGRGMAVTVLERDATGHGASRVAAGMLAPVAEVEFGRGRAARAGAGAPLGRHVAGLCGRAGGGGRRHGDRAEEHRHAGGRPG